MPKICKLRIHELPSHRPLPHVPMIAEGRCAGLEGSGGLLPTKAQYAQKHANRRDDAPRVLLLVLLLLFPCASPPPLPLWRSDTVPQCDDGRSPAPRPRSRCYCLLRLSVGRVCRGAIEDMLLFAAVKVCVGMIERQRKRNKERQRKDRKPCHAILFGASRGPRPSVTGQAKPGQSRIRGWPGCVQGQSRTQAIRGWPGPPTDNPPHAKSPAVHCKDRVLDSIILLIRISYNNKSVILALPTTSTRPKTHIHTPTRAINIHTHQPQTHTHRLAIGSNI